jgi:hypothetical protein
MSFIPSTAAHHCCIVLRAPAHRQGSLHDTMESTGRRERRNTRNHIRYVNKLSNDQFLCTSSALPYPALHCTALPYHALHCPTLSCPVFSFSFTSLCFLSNPALSHPIPLLAVTQKVDSNFIENVRSKIFPALHIGLALELDSETTITGSCSFRTGTPGADGSPIAVGVSYCA